MKEKKLYAERREKATQLYAEVTAAAERVEALKQAKEYFVPLFTAGAPVKHNTFGAGKVVASDGEYVEISFKKSTETKRFILLPAIANGFLTRNVRSFEEKREQFKMVMINAAQIKGAWEQANRRFAHYAEYLDT